MVSLYKDPEGKKVFSKTPVYASKQPNPSKNVPALNEKRLESGGSSSDTKKEDSTEVNILRKRVAELEQEVSELKVGVVLLQMCFFLTV